MCSRGIWQLQRLTLRYCPWGGSSSGARDFIRAALPELAMQNPQVEFVTAISKNKAPAFVAEYVTGSAKEWSVENKNVHDIVKVATRLRDQDGRKVKEVKRPHISATPTLQGGWQPRLDLGEFTVVDL